MRIIHGNIDGIRLVEELVKSTGACSLIHDGSARHQAFGRDGQSIAYTRVYEVFLESAPWFMARRVNIRFWYDGRTDRAMIKVSDQGLAELLKKLPPLSDKVETLDI